MLGGKEGTLGCHQDVGGDRGKLRDLSTGDGALGTLWFALKRDWEMENATAKPEGLWLEQSLGSGLRAVSGG
jgi:hypothetical protein